MNNRRHGYGIYRWADGGVYYGEFKENNQEGQGYQRWPSGTEYYGEWKNDMQWGEGVSQTNGKLERVKIE
jgi:hypothetical protein